MSQTNISTPQALVQTANGKQFYVFSDPISVDTSEITLLDIDNIGSRDIFISFEFGNDETADQSGTIRIKSDGNTVLQRISRQYYAQNWNVRGIIIPRNSSLTVTAQQSTNTSNWTVVCFGKYLPVE